MDRKTVVGKTAKGLRESLGKSHELTRDTRELLKEIDGKSSVGDLLGTLEDWTEGEMMLALKLLLDGDFVRELELDVPRGNTPRSTPAPVVPAKSGEELDFTSEPVLDEAAADRSKALERQIAQLRAEAEAKQQAEAAAKGEAEMRARREADERAAQLAATLARQAAEIKAQQQAAAQKAQHEAAENAKREAAERARREAEEKVQGEAEEQARREAAEQSRREAEEQARRDAAETARRAEEERARRETEERDRREAEEQARREAEEQARRETEERARREAEEQARREAEEQARRETEERARREADEQARREAEEKTRREAEERALKEVEERVKREVETEARREAEERARQDAVAQAEIEAQMRADQAAEDQARREAEDQAKRAAVEHTRREAEEQVERAAEELARQDMAEHSSREVDEPVVRVAAEAEAVSAAVMAEVAPPRPPIKWGKVVVLALAALLVAGIAALQFASFGGRIDQLEKMASAQFQQPVKIRALQLSLLPQPHWLVEGLSIGSQGQIRAPRVKLMASLGDMFGDLKAFESVHVDSLVLNEEGLGWLMFGNAPQGQLKLGRITAANVKLEAKNFALPALNAKVELGPDGKWSAMSGESADGKFSIDVQGAGDGVQVSVKAAALAAVFPAAPGVEDVVATGLGSRAGINFKAFTARVSSGTLSGTARLNWTTGLRLDGELSGKQIDAAQLFAGFFDSGRIEGKGRFSLNLSDTDKSSPSQRLDGDFSIDKGVLVGVDLGRMLQSGASGGQTQFTRLSGSGSFLGGRTQLQSLRLDAGKLSARGNADVDPNQAIRGQFVVELNLGGEQRRTGVALSGTFKPPYKSVEWVRR